MASITAIPTEYMGVRFRSKSEAMFAHVMDSKGLMWVYEPAWLSVFQYKPDFLVIEKVGNRLWGTVIEYKPKMPTKTYMENLTKVGGAIGNKLSTAGFSEKSFTIVVLDFFNEFNPSYLSFNGIGWKEYSGARAGSIKTISERAVQRAKDFRFDLESN